MPYFNSNSEGQNDGGQDYRRYLNHDSSSFCPPSFCQSLTFMRLKRHCDPSAPPKNLLPEFHSGGLTASELKRQTAGFTQSDEGSYGLVTTAS